MFEELKKSFQKRIERNAVKSELNGEIVYLKKSKIPLIGDWGRIYPAVNEDGTWNIPNLIFGGWKNLMKLIIVLIILAMFFFAFKETFANYEALKNLPCVQTCIQNNLFT